MFLLATFLLAGLYSSSTRPTRTLLSNSLQVITIPHYFHKQQHSSTAVLTSTICLCVLHVVIINNDWCDVTAVVTFKQVCRYFIRVVFRSSATPLGTFRRAPLYAVCACCVVCWACCMCCMRVSFESYQVQARCVH